MDDLVKALRSGEQADMDGILVKVSRQACEEAADAIEALQARVAEKDAEIARLHAAARDVVRAYQEENFMRHADMHPASCGCLRCEIDRLGNACGHFEKPSFPPAPPSKETAMSEAERDAQIEEGTWR